MDWAKKRQYFIETILALVGVAILAVVAVAVFYKAPSCMDGKQNQNETGIDCGGSCTYLCSSDEIFPHITFVRAVSPEYGRTDVIAYIDNPNAGAKVRAAKYTIELYDKDQQLITTKSGVIALPPASTVPLFIPNFYNGNKQVASAFLSFDPASLLWIKDTVRPVLPSPNNIQINEGVTPKITASLTNMTATPVYNQTIVATVFDENNNAIAASQTVVPVTPSQGSAAILFTWNQAFASKVARVEILPAPAP